MQNEILQHKFPTETQENKLMIKFWQDAVEVWVTETESLTSYKSWNTVSSETILGWQFEASSKTEPLVQLIDSTLLYVVFNIICILFFLNSTWCWETQIRSLSTIVFDVIASVPHSNCDWMMHLFTMQILKIQTWSSKWKRNFSRSMIFPFCVKILMLSQQMQMLNASDV